MAIKNIIAQGIGFSPGSVKFIPTLGFSVSAVGSAVMNPTLLTLVDTGLTITVPNNDGSTIVTITNPQ